MPTATINSISRINPLALNPQSLTDPQGYEHLLEQIARLPRLGTLNLACNSITSLQAQVNPRISGFAGLQVEAPRTPDPKPNPDP